MPNQSASGKVNSAGIKKLLNDLRNKHLDLTGRNRLLNYRHTAKSSLRIVDEAPNQLWKKLLDNGELRFEPVPEPTKKELINNGYLEIEEWSGTTKQLKEDPDAKEWAAHRGIETSWDVPRNGIEEDLESKHTDNKIQTIHFPQDLDAILRSILQKANSSIQETGANILYLALGFLQWSESADSDRTHLSPLYMLPVTLKRGRLVKKEGSFRYSISYSGEDIIPNLSLREKLRHDFGLALPSLDEETEPEDYLNKVQQVLLKNKPTWEVKRFLTLGLFNFSKLLMYLDLDPDQWDDHSPIHKHPIVKQLLGGNTGEEGIGIDPPEDHNIDNIKHLLRNYPIVFDADSSQHSTIVDGLKGKNLVIEGPPGTGKSQTIANLIAAFLSKGQKVLFVAEKLAALEVVKHRLDKANLGYFCLDLHSHKTHKVKVLKDLEERIKKRAKFVSPESLRDEYARHELIQRKLNSYTNTINGVWKNTGLSIHEILSGATRYRSEFVQNPVEFKVEGLDGNSFTSAFRREMEDFQDRLIHHYKDIIDQLESGEQISTHPWYGVETLTLQMFDAERVCESISSWNKKLAILLEYRGTLSETLRTSISNIPASLPDYSHLHAEMQKVPELKGDEYLAALPRLDLNGVEAIESYLSHFKVLNVAYKRIDGLFTESFQHDKKRIENLQETVDLAHKYTSKRCQLSTLVDASPLAKDLNVRFSKHQELISWADNLVSCDNHTHISQTQGGLRELVQFFDLVGELPPVLWKYRSSVFENSELDQYLPEIKTTIDDLSEKRDSLKDIFNFDELPSSKDLHKYVYSIRDVKYFKWLDKSYRNACRELKHYSANSSVRVKDLIAQLDKYVEYVELFESFEENIEYKNSLGDLFRGLATDMDMVSSLRDWYRAIREEYGAGFGERVCFANALIGLESNDAQTIVNHRNTSDWDDLSSAVASLDELTTLLDGYRDLKAIDIDLVGESGVLSTISSSLDQLKGNVHQYYRNPDVDIFQLLSNLDLLKEAHSSRAEWDANNTPVKYFDNNVVLKPDDLIHQTETINCLTHTKELASILNNEVKSDLVINCINTHPREETISSIRDSACQMGKLLKENEVERDTYLQLASVDLQKWLSASGLDLELMLERNNRALDDQEYFANWVDYLHVWDQAKSYGMGTILELTEAEEIQIDDIRYAYRSGAFNILAHEVYKEHKDVPNYVGQAQETLQKQFRIADVNIITKLQRQEIAFAIDKNKVAQGIAMGKAGDFTEYALIKRELGKKRRHIPIRQLIRRANNALLSLKPCFMMGPMSVAQYLKPGLFEFDVVIMDEASQIKPEDAIGAVARGKQLIVVGDPKQLPPSRYFDRVLDESDDEDEMSAIEGTESILDAATNLFQSKSLQWHYRSRHESLIAFSNQSFYHGELILFPSPHKMDKEFGVKYSRLPSGRFVNRRNKEEAKQIVKATVNHLQEHPNESLGIVAMSSEQRSEIEWALEYEMKLNPQFRKAIEANVDQDDPIFVKNLENVQGDERDVIYISMTYGPREPGQRVMQRFGPINSDVGWRRLNVLFTRSRKRMHVFSSMSSGDISVSSNSRKGVQALHDFLFYLESGQLPLTGEAVGKPPDSDFEIAVMKALGEKGYDCDPQVGAAGYFIDLGVKDPGNPGRYLMGIECDGATYHSAKSARDRDRLRQSVLEGLNWKIRRIWSTDWFKNPKAVLVPIIRELDKLKTKPSEHLDAHEEEMPGEVFPEAERVSSYRRIEEEVEPQHIHVEEPSKFDPLKLEETLLKFESDNIRSAHPNTPANERLLRPEMLKALLKYMPTSPPDFLQKIPLYLRDGTDHEEKHYLSEVLDIIDSYT